MTALLPPRALRDVETGEFVRPGAARAVVRQPYDLPASPVLAVPVGPAAPTPVYAQLLAETTAALGHAPGDLT